MSVPGIVQSTLDDEEIAARVSLGGEDELFVTSTSSIVYRAEGLLSDESISEYPHEAERLTLSEGRRKTRFSLEYPLEGTKEFTVPSKKTEAVLHPVLAGVLNGNGITDPGESVVQTYRFSELTVIVTSQRLVKHIGEAVWDEDYEEYHYDDVTRLSFEPGSHATQIVIGIDGRQQRIKAPNDEADDLRERLKRALFAYHEVDSLNALNELLAPEETDEDPSDSGGSMDFGDGVDPLSTNADGGIGSTADSVTTGRRTSEPVATSQADQRVASSSSSQAGAARGGVGTAPETAGTGEPQQDDEFTESGFEPAPVDDEAVGPRLDALEEAIQTQSAILERQQQTIERLIEELRQGR